MLGRLLSVALGAAPLGRAHGADFGATFREPPANAARPSLALGLASLAPSEVEARRQLTSLRACGAGGVLVRVESGNAEAWQRLRWVAAACKDMGLELGLCDFLLPEEESRPKLQRLVWTASRAEDAQGGRAEGSAAYRPADGYREVARLAVPVGGEVLAHQVVDWSAGPEPAGGPWQTFRFGGADVAPSRVDCFDAKAVFGHVNRVLVESQGRLASAYGTTFAWYQWSGPGPSELFWFSDLADVFLKSSGLGLTRHLPVLAGVGIGGEKNADYVRRHVAQAIRETWRQRCAQQVDDLVHEAGLEAGVAADEAPMEPEDVAFYFRRVTLSPAETPERRLRNERAAGAGRALGHRFTVGRVCWTHVSPTPAQVLLPFRCRHEVDGLFCDGANRILLDWPGEVPSDGEGFAQLQAVCRYAHRCQVVLQQGDAVGDLLVWSAARPASLAGYSCDWVGRRALEAAPVRKGAILFESERRYRDVAVTADVLQPDADVNRLRLLAAAGVNIWLAASGAEGEEGAFARVAGTPGFKRLGDPGAGAPLPDLQWTGDVEGMDIRFVHRRSATDEVYYIANAGAAGGTATCLFRDTGRGVPSRWEPVDGEAAEDLTAVRSADGRVSAPLFLGPHESCFVVFAR